MNAEPATRMRILVAIASYGVGNDQYLAKLVAEYRAMAFATDIVVLSNIPKNVAPGVEVMVVDLKGKNPWSLPFPHKQLFADRLNDYDLFIYSEDDTLLSEKNICAFLRVSAVLPENEIPGFLRFERGPLGTFNFPEVHGHFHWDPQSVRTRGGYTLAFFTNEHSACYVLTRVQLQRAAASGGFLVEPHEGKYDLLCSAATDPYMQCGLQKLICISHLDDFLVHHLPNKYCGTRFGVDDPEMRRQVAVLLKIGQNGHRPGSLFETETKLVDASYSKDYYEPVEPAIISAIPNRVRSVLSIGCGQGAMEACLADRKLQVVAVPLDPVIFGAAEDRDIEVVHGDFETVRAKLTGRVFDCLMLSNVLHLVRNPVALLRSFAALLSEGAVVIALVPNMANLSSIRRQIYGNGRVENLRSYERTGIHLTSHGTVKKWFRDAGLRLETMIDLLPERAQTVGRLTLGLVNPFLASEVIAIAKRM
jgi:SAM-dependent methyltransferase